MFHDHFGDKQQKKKWWKNTSIWINWTTTIAFTTIDDPIEKFGTVKCFVISNQTCEFLHWTNHIKIKEKKRKKNLNDEIKTTHQ